MPQPVKMTIRNVRACPRAGWNMPDSGIADFSDKMTARGYPRAHGHLDTPNPEALIYSELATDPPGLRTFE